MALTIPQALVKMKAVGATFSISKEKNGSPLPVITLPPKAPQDFILLRVQLMAKKSELLQALEAHCKPANTESVKPTVSFGMAKSDLPQRKTEAPTSATVATPTPPQTELPPEQIGLLNIDPEPPQADRPIKAVSFLNPSKAGENGKTKGARVLTGRWTAPTALAAKAAEFQRTEAAMKGGNLTELQQVRAWARHNVLRGIYTGEADTEGGNVHRWLDECGTYEELAV